MLLTITITLSLLGYRNVTYFVIYRKIGSTTILDVRMNQMIRKCKIKIAGTQSMLLCYFFQNTKPGCTKLTTKLYLSVWHIYIS